MAYLNGRVPDALLVAVEDNDRLFAPAAASFVAMRAAAARAGVAITIAEPAGAYRSIEVQRDMSARPWAYNLNPSSTIKLSPPGYSSHGFGTRFDAGTGNSWLLKNASRFGWSREFGASDPNHWMHDGRTATTGSVTGPLTSEPVIPKGNNVTTLYYLQDSSPLLYALAGDSPGTPANWLETTGQGLANQWSAQIGGPSAALNKISWDAFKGFYLEPLRTTGSVGGSVPAGLATKADITAEADRVIAAVPPAVIVEQKKPGN